MAENLCSWPCCHIAFSNTFHGLNNCQLLALVRHLRVLQSASLILLTFTAWFSHACCAHITHCVCILDEKGGRGKGGAPTSTRISLAGIVLCGLCQDESGWKSGHLSFFSFYSRSRWEQRGLERPWAKKICTGSLKKFIVANIKMTCPL